MEADNRKRKGEDLEHDRLKKQRLIENSETNYLELLPLEILFAVTKYAGAYPIVLLSLTNTQFNEMLSRDNKLWYLLYSSERDINRTAVDLDNSSLREPLTTEHNEEFFLDWYDDELTRDTAQIQRELISDDDCIKYLSVVNFPSAAKEVALKLIGQYDEEVDYKELAVDEWLKRANFEIWNDLACESLYRSDCTCVHKKEELVLYDEGGGELELGDASEDDDANIEVDSSFESDEDASAELDEDEQSSDTSGSDGEEEIAPVQLTAELRDRIIASVADSPLLKVFVQVLGAAVLGQVPAATCPDTEKIALMKLKHDTVLFGNVIDEVTEQIAHAVNLDAQSCAKRLFCALQKLCLNDLLYLNQQVRARFPYLATVFSVHNIERSVPSSWYDLHAYNELHWACNFRASMASDDELDSVPNWLAMRHSVLRMMRMHAFSASPSTADYGVSALVEFITKILQSVVATKETNSSTIEVTEVDILKAVSQEPRTTEFIQPYTLYNTTSKLVRENMLHLKSDSECCSYASSYSDASEEDEDLAQFAHENRHCVLPRTGTAPLPDDTDQHEDSEDDLTDHQEITALIKGSIQGLEDDTSPLLMRSAVVYAQTDLTAEQLDDFNDDQSECSAEEQVEDTLLEWLQHDSNSYNPDYVEKMIHSIKQDASYYAGNGEVGESAEEAISFIDSVVPNELPDLRQDLSAEQRTKILEVRRETNRILKAEIMREHHEYLLKKYERLSYNYANYDTSHAIEGKSLEINFFSDNESNIKRIITEAIELIDKNEMLKTIKVRDYIETCPDEDSNAVLDSQMIIDPLFSAIEASSSIESLMLQGCHFVNERSLVHLLQNKKLVKFHFKFCRATQCLKARKSVLNEVAKHTSLKELAVDYSTSFEYRTTINQTLIALSGSLEVLKLLICGRPDLPSMEALLRKCGRSMQTIELQFDRFDLSKVLSADTAELRNNLIEAAKPAKLIFTQY